MVCGTDGAGEGRVKAVCKEPLGVLWINADFRPELGSVGQVKGGGVVDGGWSGCGREGSSEDPGEGLAAEVEVRVRAGEVCELVTGDGGEALASSGEFWRDGGGGGSGESVIDGTNWRKKSSFVRAVFGSDHRRILRRRKHFCSRLGFRFYFLPPDVNVLSHRPVNRRSRRLFSRRRVPHRPLPVEGEVQHSVLPDPGEPSLGIPGQSENTRNGPQPVAAVVRVGGMVEVVGGWGGSGSGDREGWELGEGRVAGRIEFERRRSVGRGGGGRAMSDLDLLVPCPPARHPLILPLSDGFSRLNLANGARRGPPSVRPLLNELYLEGVVLPRLLRPSLRSALGS